MIKNHLTFLQPTSSYRELILLDEIGKNPRITQYRLAEKAGIVPAMVNNYIKDLVKQGLLEVNGNRTRNVTYSLTDAGERKKIDLLLHYFQEAVSLYKNAKEGIKHRLADFYREGIRNIVFYGARDTAELAYTSAEEIGLTVLGIVDSDSAKHGKEMMGKFVMPPDVISELRPDAVVISSFGYQNQIYEQIKSLEHKGIKVRKL